MSTRRKLLGRLRRSPKLLGRLRRSPKLLGRLRRTWRIPVVAVLAALGLAVMSPVASARAEVFFAHLTPDQVKPAGPDGGYADIALQVDDEKNVVCYLARWDEIGEPVGIHVHLGEPGAQGPVMIDLPLPDYNDAGCTPADHAIMSYLNDNPRGHYVDIHTDTNPQGAVRGQLAEDKNRRTPRTAPSSASSPPPPPPQPPPHGTAPPATTPPTPAPPPTTSSAPASPPAGEAAASPPGPGPAGDDPASSPSASAAPPPSRAAASASAPGPGAPGSGAGAPAATAGPRPNGASATPAPSATGTGDSAAAGPTPGAPGDGPSLTPPAGPAGLGTPSSTQAPGGAAGATGPAASLARDENVAAPRGGGDSDDGVSGALVGAFVIAGLGGAGAAAYGLQRRRRTV